MSHYDPEYNKQYKRENRKFFKAHGLCQVCGQNVPEPGRVTCSDCLKYNQEYKAIRLKNETPEEREKRLNYYRETGKTRYKERRVAGLCTKCGKPAQGGKSMCTECLLHRRLMDRARRDTYSRDYENICTRCRKKPRMEGGKVCADCYPILVEMAAHMREVGRPQDASREYIRQEWRAIRRRNDTAERDRRNAHSEPN